MSKVFYLVCWIAFLLAGLSAREYDTEKYEDHSAYFPGENLISVQSIEDIYSALMQENYERILPVYQELNEERKKAPGQVKAALPDFNLNVHFESNGTINQAYEAFILHLERPTNETKNDFISKCTDLEEILEHLTDETIKKGNNVIDKLLNNTKCDHERFLSSATSFLNLFKAGLYVQIPYTLFTREDPEATARLFATYIDDGQYLVDRVEFESIAFFKSSNCKIKANKKVNQTLYDHMVAHSESSDIELARTGAVLLNRKFPGAKWTTLVFKEGSKEELEELEDNYDDEIYVKNSQVCDMAVSPNISMAVFDKRRMIGFSSDTKKVTDNQSFPRDDYMTAANAFRAIGGQPDHTLVIYKDGCLRAVDPMFNLTGYEMETHPLKNYRRLRLPFRMYQRTAVPKWRIPKVNEKAYNLLIRSLMRNVAKDGNVNNVQNVTEELVSNSVDENVQNSTGKDFNSANDNVQNIAEKVAEEGILQEKFQMVATGSSAGYYSVVSSLQMLVIVYFLYLM